MQKRLNIHKISSLLPADNRLALILIEKTDKLLSRALRARVRPSRVKVQFLKGYSKQSFGIYVYDSSKQICFVLYDPKFMVGTSVVITSVCMFNCLCKNS